MTMIDRLVNLTALLALIAGLTACTSAPVAQEPAPSVTVPPPQNMRAQTDELGMVADAAIYLAERYGPEQVLVVLDIDNTLLAMNQDLGSDQWFYWQRDLEQEDPCSALLVNDRLAAQGALFFAGAMRPTQADGPEQVRRLQDAGLRVIAITSRGPDYRLQTFRELRRNGIAFWPSALPPQRGFAEEFVPQGGTRPARYEDGVFLTAGQNKGDMLKALLERTNTPWPLVVVIADDKGYSLTEMMEAFDGTDTAVVAWRYSREDATVAALDRQGAARQWDLALPALATLQELFGTDNFELPPAQGHPACADR